MSTVLGLVASAAAIGADPLGIGVAVGDVVGSFGGELTHDRASAKRAPDHNDWHESEAR